MRLRPTRNDIKPTTALRKALTEGPLPAVGIWGGTAHHAQLAEEAGFQHFGISGAATTTQLLGLPDAGLITLSELVENVRRICQAVSIPVVVDCDTGFGNAINVIRTVEEVIRAGAAGLFIEDQVAPKRCGFVKGKELIPIEEAVGKYRAACDVRDRLDKDFIVMARTDARGAVGGGMEEVMRRGRAYLDAGVDVLYVEALQNREELWQVRKAFPQALLKCTTQAIKPGLTNEEVRELRLVTTGLHISRIGSIAMHDFLRDFRERGETAANEFNAAHQGHPLSGFGVFDLTGFPQVHALEQRYLPAERMERYEQSVGVYDPRVGQNAKS
jgi:2-methylisocitrate lyase-like PEP mutase family enzyme